MIRVKLVDKDAKILLRSGERHIKDGEIVPNLKYYRNLKRRGLIEIEYLEPDVVSEEAEEKAEEKAEEAGEAGDKPAKKGKKSQKAEEAKTEEPTGGNSLDTENPSIDGF